MVKTDLLLEALFVLLKIKPLYIFLLPVWLLKGKAYLKQRITRRVELDVSVLPYRSEFLDNFKAQREQGDPSS